jgi:hypothetical protein
MAYLLDCVPCRSVSWMLRCGERTLSTCVLRNIFPDLGAETTFFPQVTPLFLIPATSVVGDGKMVGDKGFDPMGLATSMQKLNNYREAELKHCRLAMLAALGWPVAELLQGPLSRALGLPDLLAPGEKCVTAAQCVDSLSRAPSVLNGGLDKISPVYWGSVLLLSAVIEFYGLKVQKNKNYLPGDLGFDPLGLYQKLDPKGKQDMQLKEVRIMSKYNIRV